MQSIDSIEIYAYGTSECLVCKKEGIKCNNIIKRCKMINFDCMFLSCHVRVSESTQAL